ENPYDKGAEGQYIVQLKKDLTKLGYGNFPKNPSKKYGNVTAKVIEELQQDHKLTINGVADDATLDKIRQLIKQGYKKPSKSITKTEYTNYRQIGRASCRERKKSAERTGSRKKNKRRRRKGRH